MSMNSHMSLARHITLCCVLLLLIRCLLSEKAEMKQTTGCCFLLHIFQNSNQQQLRNQFKLVSNIHITNTKSWKWQGVFNGGGLQKASKVMIYKEKQNKKDICFWPVRYKMTAKSPNPFHLTQWTQGGAQSPLSQPHPLCCLSVVISRWLNKALILPLIIIVGIVAVWTY